MSKKPKAPLTSDQRLRDFAAQGKLPKTAEQLGPKASPEEHSREQQYEQTLTTLIQNHVNTADEVCEGLVCH